MTISYKKLWKLMIDNDYTKMKLCEDAGITTNAMARMGRGEDVRLDTLVKICELFACTLDDIVELIPDDKKEV